MITLFEPDLNYILSKLSEREILEYYVGSDLSKSVRSPFRDDKYPTITFKDCGNKIIWRDWKTSEKGDVFTWVMKLYNISFYEAIITIYNNLIKGNNTIIYREKNKFYELKNNLKKDFIITTQSFTFLDYKYWKEYGISLNTLLKYNVYSIKSFYISTTPEYITNYSNNNPIYGYKFQSEDVRWKIYMPYKNKKRFLFNGTINIIEGFEQLPHFDNLLIITKSLKDVMLLYELGYNAISLQGESNPLTKEMFNKLTYRFTNIISLYDNDEAGLIGSNRLKNDYGFDNLIIPYEYGTKDLSDTYRKYGKNICITILNELLKNVNR